MFALLHLPTPPNTSLCNPPNRLYSSPFRSLFTASACCASHFYLHIFLSSVVLPKCFPPYDVCRVLTVASPSEPWMISVCLSSRLLSNTVHMTQFKRQCMSFSVGAYFCTPTADDQNTVDIAPQSSRCAKGGHTISTLLVTSSISAYTSA